MTLEPLPQPQPEPPQTIRMEKTDAPPSEEELGVLLYMAKGNAGGDVEQSWAVPGCKNSFLLVVRMSSAESSPSWTLTEIEGKETNLVWTSQSQNVVEICEIINKLNQALTRSEFAPPVEADRSE